MRQIVRQARHRLAEFRHDCSCAAACDRGNGRLEATPRTGHSKSGTRCDQRSHHRVTGQAPTAFCGVVVHDRDWALDVVRRIVTAVDVPVTADIEDGYADDPDGVAHTVEALVASGAVGANIEDA